MRSRLGAGLVLMAALVAPMLWAQEPADPPPQSRWQRARFFRGGEHRGMMWQRFLDDAASRERTGITKEQADKLRALGIAAAKARVRARADRELKHLDLAELMQAEKPDRVAIDKKLREMADVQYTAMKARTDNLLAIHEILTAEQREKIRAFVRERMQQRMREFRGPRPGMMGPPRGPHGPGGPPGEPPPPGETPKDN